MDLDALRDRKSVLISYSKSSEYLIQRGELVQQMKVRQQILLDMPLGRVDEIVSMVQLRGEVAAYQSIIGKVDRDLEDLQADIELALEEEAENQEIDDGS